MHCAKNVKNYCGGGSGLGVTTTSDRRLENIMMVNEDVEMTGERGLFLDGYGVQFHTCNGATGQVDGNITTWESQVDTDNYIIKNNSVYQYGATLVEIKRSGWYLLECTVVIAGPGGVNTQNKCIGFLVHRPPNDEYVLRNATCVIDEPASNGLAVGCNGFHWLEAGWDVKVNLASSSNAGIRDNVIGGLRARTYWRIVKF